MEFYADLYRVGHRLGLSPAQVDACELWQVYAMLGYHRPEEWWEIAAESYDDVEPGGGKPRPGTGRPLRSGDVDRLARDRDKFAARREAAQEGRDLSAEDLSGMDSGAFAVMRRVLGG